MKVAITISQLRVMLRSCISTGKINKTSVGELFRVIFFVKSSKHENILIMKKVELWY